MLSLEQLTDARDRGIISSAQHDQLVAMAAHEAAAEKPQQDSIVTSDENFRLVGGGNDVFTGLGIVLLLSGLWSTVTHFIAPFSLLSLAAMTVLVWALAEFVTRQRRMKFSSLILSAAFVLVGAGMIWLVLDSTVQLTIPENMINLIGQRDTYRWAGIGGFLSLAALAIVYFFRFRVPFMAVVLAVSVIGLIGIFIADILFGQVLAYRIQIGDPDQLRETAQWLLTIPLICGLLVFATGVALDIHDRRRETVWSDCAFWLHVISAPLIVHPMFVLATGQSPWLSNGGASSSATITLLVLVLIFFYVALAIDRRSLLVPSLGYFATVGIYFLIQAANETTGIPSFAVILLVIGLVIILFGVGWQRIRRLVVGNTLPHMLLKRLPPVMT